MGPTQTPAEDHRVDSTLRVGSGDICVIYTYPTSHDGSMVDWDIYLQIYHTNQRLNVGKHTSSIDPTGYTYIYMYINKYTWDDGILWSDPQPIWCLLERIEVGNVDWMESQGPMSRLATCN